MASNSSNPGSKSVTGIPISRLVVTDRHVALYVNAFTRGLGAQGRAAIEFLIEEAARVDS